MGEQKKRVRVPVHLPLLGELRYEPRVMAVVNPAWRGRQLGKITVESVLGKPVEILQATARGPIEVTARATEPQRKYEVAVRVADDAPAGPIGALVTIVTDSPGETIIQVPVYGNVHPWIWVLPEAVLLKVGGGSSQAALAEVRLRWPVAAPVKLGRPQCDDPRLTAEVVPGEDEVQDGMELATATLRIISATDFEPADFQTTVRLATGWENCPSVEVPVFVRTD